MIGQPQGSPTADQEEHLPDWKTQVSQQVECIVRSAAARHAGREEGHNAAQARIPAQPMLTPAGSR